MLTTHVAKQYRLQQWANAIRECKSSGLTVAQWCGQNSITKASYYYRLRRVRETMLLSEYKQEIVSIPNELAQKSYFTETLSTGELRVSIGDSTIHVDAATPPSLLKMVMEVIRDAP